MAAGRATGGKRWEDIKVDYSANRSSALDIGSEGTGQEESDIKLWEDQNVSNLDLRRQEEYPLTSIDHQIAIKKPQKVIGITIGISIKGRTS